MLLLAPLPSMATQHALLIGISDYADSRIEDLEGPVNDVSALRQVLINNWQFDAEHITTLINKQATEQAILNQLDRLASDTAPGDNLFIYFSGHGTSASDPSLGSRLHLPDGSGALVSSDFNPDKLQLDSLKSAVNDGLLIGRYELKPRLQALDEERNVLVAFDACFSGNTARGLDSAYMPKRKRMLNILSAFRELLSDENASEPPYPAPADDSHFLYKNTVYFGAAAEHQLAVDFSQAEIDAGLISSIDGKAHGGFTDSLLRVLSHSPTNTGPNTGLSHARLFNRLLDEFNTYCKSCGHTPVSLPRIATDEVQLLSRTVFGVAGEGSEQQDSTSVSDPQLADRLIIDNDQQETKLSLAPLLPNRALQLHEQTQVKVPDIQFEREQDALLARSADGQLITRFDNNVSTPVLREWLNARQWLKQRMDIDRKNGQDLLHVNFRHPAQGNQVTEGDFIHFNIISERDSQLVALLLDSKGQIAVLYPINKQEALATLIAGKSQRMPAIDQFQLQVTPPWGSDSVLFYEFPASHALVPSLIDDMLALSAIHQIELTDPRLQRLQSLLDTGKVPYSASSIRIVARPLS